MMPLVHIGLHKTATTWMRKHLFTAANGFAPLDRVTVENAFDRTGVFDFDPAAVRARFAEALAQSEQNGKTPVISLEHFTGTPFNRGLTIPLYAERLKAVFPDAKILLVIREQRALIASWYGLYVRSGGACSIRDFMQPPDHGAWSPIFRFDFLKYDGIVALYHRLFGAEHVRVLAYERFRASPQEFLRDVTGGDHTGDMPVDTAENAARSAVGLAVQRRINPLLQRGEANGWSPMAIPNAHRVADPFFAKLGSIVPSPAENFVSRRRAKTVTELCAGRFEESNRSTQALTGLPLLEYGYAL
ncbi:MAG: hypothetical protein IT567_07170 [Alphaproteobacteria bacterium]|nr:hypothetical protein [Alphaproteobacteria bacterium]